MVTYCIENEHGQVMGYSTRLSDAKQQAVSLKIPRPIVLAMQGPYKYEGFHKYRLQLVKGKWVKLKAN